MAHDGKDLSLPPGSSPSARQASLQVPACVRWSWTCECSRLDRRSRNNAGMSISAPGVRLREITRANRPEVEALTVTEVQARYVTGVAESLVESAETPDACPWFRAVYAGEEPVGFVMLSDGITVVNPDYLGPYYLWRLLIDQRHQGPGLWGCGTQAGDRARVHAGRCAGAGHLGWARAVLACRLLPAAGLPADRRGAPKRVGARTRSVVSPTYHLTTTPGATGSCCLARRDSEPVAPVTVRPGARHGHG